MENIHGVRITPNVYTTTTNLDTLVLALNEIVEEQNGKVKGEK